MNIESELLQRRGKSWLRGWVFRPDKDSPDFILLAYDAEATSIQRVPSLAEATFVQRPTSIFMATLLTAFPKAQACGAFRRYPSSPLELV